MSKNETGHSPHPLELHHQARPIKHMCYISWTLYPDPGLTIVLGNILCSTSMLLSGINCLNGVRTRTGEQRKKPRRHWRWLLLKGQPPPAQVLSNVLPRIKLRRMWGEFEKTHQDDNNWNEFPFNHHMNAPSVKDLNPSSNFEVDSPLAFIPFGPYIWTITH